MRNIFAKFYSITAICRFSTLRSPRIIRDEVNSLDNQSDISEMKSLALKNPNNIIYSYLNINSVRNKFKKISNLISDNVEILIVAETKLGSSFPTT